MKIKNCECKKNNEDAISSQINCWEYMQCGREPCGKNALERGVCPAAVEASYDGINNGINAGRVCWAVAGTCCGGKVQGSYAEKRKSCISCPFYQTVQKQESTSEAARKLFELFSKDQKSPLLNFMTCMKAKAGDALATQGELRDRAYIIDRGSCLVLVEKEGTFHPVGHRNRGELIGITSLLTGEPQRAHVEAETDMELWVLHREFFEKITGEDHDVLEFLTEVVASRFDSKRPISDRQIGKYIASDIIGTGAFSIVYKGLHESLNMPVAIKMLKHDMAINPDFLEPFKKEAKFLAKLKHENIVQVYDIEERYRTVFIVMEYLMGNTLKELFESNDERLSTRRIISFILQICSGLNVAHNNGIVHQDIKPGNIFIQPNDKIKILDFGLACPSGSENFLTGTPFYMSPEQVQCLPVDQRSDIYSLGLVVYKMLTGKRAFDGKDMWKVMEMRTERDIPDPGETVTDIQPNLRNFILKACSRDPNLRYQNITEVLAAIQPLVSEYGLQNDKNSQIKRKIRTLYLVYEDKNSDELDRAIERFNYSMQRIGAELKPGDFIDL